MRKRILVVAAVGCAAVLVAGGLVASNMGFKNNYPLDSTGVNSSKSGTQTIALPYNQQTNIVDAEDLINDINTDAGASVVGSIARFLKTSDSLDSYTGFSGNNFPIVPGEGYQVNVTAAVNYIIVGSHDPSLTLDFDATGTNGSKSGTTLYSYPYHAVAADAEELIMEINAHAGASVVGSVARFVRTSDAKESYTGFSGTNFPLVPGEAYFVNVTADVTGYKPAHF